MLLAALAGPLAGLAGCGSMRAGPEPASAPAFEAAVAEVRPGDQVQLVIWNEPEMSSTFTVNEGGEVILPKLGPISVREHTVTSLQDSVRTAYAEYLRNPSVQITVLRRVGVSGEVRAPGIFQVDLTMTLPDVLSRAGGLTEAGDPDDITVLRGTDRIRFRTAERERFVVAELRSGDQVVVGAKNFFERNPMAVVTTAIPLLGYVLQVIIPALSDL